jgi:hypothetical protein
VTLMNIHKPPLHANNLVINPFTLVASHYDTLDLALLFT